MLDYITRFREWCKGVPYIQHFWGLMSIVAMLFLLVFALTFSYNFTTSPLPNTTFVAKLSDRALLEYYPKGDLHNLTVRYTPSRNDLQLVIKTGLVRIGATSRTFESSKTFNLSGHLPITYKFWSAGNTAQDQILRLSIISNVDNTSYLGTTDYIIVTQSFSPGYEYIPGLSVEGYSVEEIPVKAGNHE